MAKKIAVDMDLEVAKLNDAADAWIDDDSGISIYTLIRRKLRAIKTSPEMRLAIYLKYCFGPALSGEDNDGWIQEAKELRKILGGL